MAKQDDSLFLLEVLVDKIRFKKSPCFADKEFKTCVAIECSAMPTLEIWDDDTGPQTGGPFVASFNSGKSCLFPLKESEIAAAKSKFNINVSVFKALPCSCLPTEISLGKATIDMTKEFVQAVQKYTADPNCVSYEALKDSFKLTDGGGGDIGEITMFFRISCFGKQIITRFQGGAGPPSLGGGMGGHSAVNRSCNEPRGMQSTNDPCGCSVGPGSGGAGRGRTGGAPCSLHGGGVGAACPQARDPYNSMPCEDPDDPCYCTGPKPPAKQQMACRNTDQYCLHLPKDCCPTGNKVIFQMPQDVCGMNHKQRAHFNFTSDGVGDMARDDPAQLIPTTPEAYPGVVYDFPKQVIKLRIGKTVEMPGRKSKLEYQFITPVVNYEKVVPVKDTRTSQCVPCCRDRSCRDCCRQC